MKIKLTETTMNIVINKLADLYNQNEIELVSSLGKEETSNRLREEESLLSTKRSEAILEIAGLLGVDTVEFLEIAEMVDGLEV